MWLAMLAMGALGALIMFYALEITTFFIGDDQVTIARTVEIIYLLGAMMPLLAVDFSIGGSLRGAGDTPLPVDCHHVQSDRYALRAGSAVHLYGHPGSVGVRRADR